MYQTILTRNENCVKTITFNRKESRNSINMTFIDEINKVLDEVEVDERYKVVVFEGQQGFFCTGMDFALYKESVENIGEDQCKVFTSAYMALLKRISLFTKVIISKVDGQVMAGGVGIVAASDLVIATKSTSFSLSEALWGLLPSMVLPYLIKRVGVQIAYRMTLTTMAIDATEAKNVHLVDELSDNLEKSVRGIVLRVARIDEKTIHHMKKYFRKIWIIDDEIEQLAMDQTSFLSSQDYVAKNIRNFLQFKKFPWEK